MIKPFDHYENNESKKRNARQVAVVPETVLGADYMDRASPVNRAYRAEKCHENLPWAAKLVLNRV